jgi:hypothetical protein
VEVLLLCIVTEFVPEDVFVGTGVGENVEAGVGDGVSVEVGSGVEVDSKVGVGDGEASLLLKIVTAGMDIIPRAAMIKMVKIGVIPAWWRGKPLFKFIYYSY